jgi:hypothetical protein
MKPYILAILISFVSSATAFSQGSGMPGPGMMFDDYDDTGAIQVGYAIVTPVSDAAGLVAFGTFGMTRSWGFGMMGATETMQAGVLPAQMTTSAMVFVNTHSVFRRDLGLAITNPDSLNASATLTLRDSNGTALGSKTVAINARRQIAVFIGELFSDRPDVVTNLAGTLAISSDRPIALAPLRFRGGVFSMIPVSSLAPSSPVPQRETGVGGPGALIFPHFVQGGWWSTEIVLANASSRTIIVRVDFYGQDGNPLSVRLNNESRTSFTNIAIPAGGVTVLAPRDSSGYSRF